VNCAGAAGGLPWLTMADSLLQQQLDEVRDLLARARALFGGEPVTPPDSLAPDLQPPH